MNTCVKCQKELEYYGRIMSIQIVKFDGTIVGEKNPSLYVCSNPKCPNYNLIQRGKD